MDDYKAELREKGEKAKIASLSLSVMATAQKNDALVAIADLLVEQIPFLLTENKKDLVSAKLKGTSQAMLDRLTLSADRIFEIAEGVRQVVVLADPVGKLINEFTRPNGLHIKKITVPLGVIAMIYEARPNVTIDAAALCLKSGNACILRGGSEAIYSNLALVKVLKAGLRKAGVDDHAVELIETTDRAAVEELLKLREYIDVVIPRGGAGLIAFVVQNSTVPVIETGNGICHTYVDDTANLEMAVNIIINAKVSRPSVCNSLETLLVHRRVMKPLLEQLVPLLKGKQVEIRGDRAICEGYSEIRPATEEDWATEYNDLILSMKTVDSLEEAITHINHYGTKHSETIVTSTPANGEEFTKRIDAAAVYVNASTRFTDGFEFGFGAEIGISTQKLHVRGPMGLESLVSFKYIIHGSGQIR